MFGTRKARGISLNTQVLYALVFLTRYLDLFWNFASLYNYMMKLIFIATSCGIVYVMKFVEPWSKSYIDDTKNADLVHPVYLIVPSFVLGIFINDYVAAGDWSFIDWFVEVLWAFSIFLESVAILPQRVVLSHHANNNANGSIEDITSHYVFTLGAYRALYIFKWVLRWYTEPHFTIPAMVVFCGILQTVLYVDFFYYYIKAKVEGTKMSLPI
jgi:ER lumen protein retaining receptor